MEIIKGLRRRRIHLEETLILDDEDSKIEKSENPTLDNDDIIEDTKQN